MRLDSNARLLVTWDGPLPDPDPCEPSATGGYLGAENQVDPGPGRAPSNAEATTFDLVWA